MLTHLATAFISLVVLVSALGPASAERRVALVIGNSAYNNTAPLKNPSNDAVDIAETLRQLDFEVIDGTDLSKREMEKRIRAFADKLVGADVGLSMRVTAFRSMAATSWRPSTRHSNPTPISTSKRSSSISY